MFYKLKDGFIVRKIGKQIMAVPVGQQTSQIHGMIALSESAEILWKVLEQGADEESIINKKTSRRNRASYSAQNNGWKSPDRQKIWVH